MEDGMDAKHHIYNSTQKKFKLSKKEEIQTNQKKKHSSSQKMNDEFNELIQVLKNFQIKKGLYDERDLEDQLCTYLDCKDMKVVRQKSSEVGRTDIIIEMKNSVICLELKVNANLSVMEQMDRYTQKYRDGVILVCWKASKNVKTVFSEVKKQINIPIEIIEVIKNQGVF